MGIDFTRPNLFRAILYFLLLYLLFRFRDLYPGGVIETAEDPMMPLQHGLAGFFGKHPFWREIAMLGLCLSNAFGITRILSRNLIYLERTFVPALIYPLVALGYSSSAMTPVTLMAAFLVIFAIDSMIKSHKREENFGYFLHASVALGFAPLLYAPSVVFLLLLPIGCSLFRQNWRSIVTAILGYFLPVFFCSYVFWGMGDDFGGTIRQIITVITTRSGEAFFVLRMEAWDYVLAGLFLVLTVLAMAGFSRTRTQLRRRAIRGFAVFGWTLLLTLGMSLLPGGSPDLLPILAVPLAALIPAAFNRKSGWYPNLLYLSMIWIVVAYNLFRILPSFQS